MTDFRGAVVQAAISQLGQGNLAEYWSDALGKPQLTNLKYAWCGIFALRCLHVAGLAEHVFWRMGAGFLSKADGHWLIPMTEKPQPGDIGYQNSPFQHHFCVEMLDAETGRVHSIDGNSGANSTVNRATHPLGHGCVYFSIAPLIELAMAGAGPSSAAVQKALNDLIMKHLGDAIAPPKLLTIDGIIGPVSAAAIRWAQNALSLPVTGEKTPETLKALGL